MLSPTLVSSVLFPLLLCSLARGQECPELPGQVDIGEAVPIRPEDIPAGCSDFEILVARGTSEPNAEDGGKFGMIVGDPLVGNVSAVLPGARGYPVQYPASSSIISGSRRGARDVAARISSQSEACPQQTFSLVGYSQGAGVMQSAAGNIPSSLYPKIKSLVMFGAPESRLSSWPSGLADKVLYICAPGDPVCDTGRCVYNHLTYIRQQYIDQAVEHIVEGFSA